MGTSGNLRLKRFFQAVASGYAQLVANTIYVLAAVPLALLFLEKRQFGLWALALQLTAYLQLIDLGMSASVSRHLIDQKDDRTSGEYGSVILTGAIVLLIQGLFVLLGGALLVLFGTQFLDIDADLQRPFKIVMLAQCAIIAADFPVRLFGHLLVAHQRNDLFNYSQIAVFAINYAVLWWCFANGFGIYSLIWANLAGWILLSVSNLVACATIRVFPASGSWGQASWPRFCELIRYGKDVFWIALGTQMIMASQTIVVTRALGLSAAATWSICMRTYSLANQLIWRPFDLSYPMLSEMVSRGEHERLLHRFKGLAILTTSLSVIAAIIFALCNRPFVKIWTHGAITWPVSNDVLLAVWMVVLSLVHCHCGLVIITKKIGFMRYIYFVEGALFILLGSYVAVHYGFPGLLATSILCSVCLSCSYGIWRTLGEFDLSSKEVVGRWLVPPLRLLLPLAILGIALHLILNQVSPIIQLGLYVTLIGASGTVLLFQRGLNPDLRAELQSRVPAGFARIFRRTQQ